MMKKSILLVDDEADIREILSLFLQDLGYTVIAAENGVDALKLFRKTLPSLVISDIKMPGMDGIELLQKIKQESPDTEFIMITGHGDMELAIISFQGQAADFITKPINVDVLEIALKKVHDKILCRKMLREYTENLETLIREKTELQNHLSSLGLMIGSISHGLKGLLTGLDGGMYLVDSGFTKDNQPQIQEGWQIVKLTVDRIRKMVLDILYYAKERELKWEMVDILSFAEDIATGMQPKMDFQKITFAKDFDSSIGAFEMDPGSIHSALINILENAMDACTRDLTGKQKQVIFGVKHDADHILFEVSDTGTGMDRETREKLFTLFFSSKGIKGTGLGLFISHKIIAQHGGSIHVASTPGYGSQFVIKLPKTLLNRCR
jgi:signal transduction histidine kinase